MAFELPALPFAPTALGPRGMCPETLEYHHGKHHLAYVNTLNKLLEDKPEFQGKSLEEIILAAHGKADRSCGQIRPQISGKVLVAEETP